MKRKVYTASFQGRSAQGTVLREVCAAVGIRPTSKRYSLTRKESGQVRVAIGKNGNLKRTVR